MEPNKLEQEIQQKLLQGSIQPSANAWDRLDAMLTVAEQQAAPQEIKLVPVKKNNRSWLYMAAAFLLMLGGGFFLMNHEAEQNVIDTNAPQVVTNKTEQPQTTAPATQVTQDTAPQYSEVADAAKPIAKKALQPKAEKSYKQVQNLTAQNHEIAQQNNVQVNNQNTQAPDAKVSKLKVDPQALLASVEGKSNPANSAVANINQPKIKVNPNTLLDNVEGELNESFRGKVINTLERKYKAVKTAVATRNLE